MPKFYWKSVLLTVAITVVGLNQIGLLIFSQPLPTRLFLFISIILVSALIINEKLTVREKWKLPHYVLLSLIALFAYLILYADEVYKLFSR